MSLQAEAAEALCSAFYGMPFVDFLGEKDLEIPGEEGIARVAWFHFGESPKDLRVSIVRPSRKEEVRIVAEWRNYFADGRNPLKGEQTMRVSTYAASKQELTEATSVAVVKVLEIYKDVLSEQGVAGQIAELAPPEPGQQEEDAADQG